MNGGMRFLRRRPALALLLCVMQWWLTAGLSVLLQLCSSRWIESARERVVLASVGVNLPDRATLLDSWFPLGGETL